MHNIDIELAGRSYPVLLDKTEELALIELIQQLNNDIAELQRRYGTKLDKQDILAMLLITYATKAKEFENNLESEKLSEKIDSLYLILENALSSR